MIKSPDNETPPKGRSEGKRFSATYQPPRENVGAKKGSHHIKTILRKFLFSEIPLPNHLQQLAGNNKTATVLDAMVAKQMYKAYQDGDNQSYKEIIDRYFGKIRDEVKHTGDVVINYGHRKPPELPKKAGDEVIDV